jgi:hypothetical protein
MRVEVGLDKVDCINRLDNYMTNSNQESYYACVEINKIMLIKPYIYVKYTYIHKLRKVYI